MQVPAQYTQWPSHSLLRAFRSPYGTLSKYAPLPEPSCTCLSESPVKESFIQCPLTEPLQRDSGSNAKAFLHVSYTYMSFRQRSPPSSSNRERRNVSRARFHVSQIPRQTRLPPGTPPWTLRRAFPEPSCTYVPEPPENKVS